MSLITNLQLEPCQGEPTEDVVKGAVSKAARCIHYIGRVCVIMDPDLAVLSRTWVLFEVGSSHMQCSKVHGFAVGSGCTLADGLPSRFASATQLVG